MSQMKKFLSRLWKSIWNYFSLENQGHVKWWLKFVGISCLVAAVVVVVIAWPVFRLAVRPRVRAAIEDARLNSFAYAATRPSDAVEAAAAVAAFLSYNVSVAIRIHNPTWSAIKLTKPLQAAFAFHDHRLFTIFVSGKGHKYGTSKKELHLVHASGEVPPDVLGAALVDDFKKQNKTGAFNLDIRLSGEIAYLGLDTIGNKRELGFSCPITLQLAPPGPEVVVFHQVNCNSEAENILF